MTDVIQCGVKSANEDAIVPRLSKFHINIVVKIHVNKEDKLDVRRGVSVHVPVLCNWWRPECDRARP
jgi:hypothetical protein